MMKKASISINMLVVIIIAIVAMVFFLIFFTGKGSELFGTFGEVSPSESGTARDTCQIACNQAKATNNCAGWCSETTGTGTACDSIINCNIKDSEGNNCDCDCLPRGATCSSNDECCNDCEGLPSYSGGVGGIAYVDSTTATTGTCT